MRQVIFVFIFIVFLPFLVLGQTMNIHKTDGQIESFLLSEIESITFSVTLVPTEGLVAYYPFNGNAKDESGNAYHGTVHGATLAKDRFNKMNSVYDFDGNNDYIELPSNPGIINQVQTTSFWVYFNNNLGSGSQYERNYIIAKSHDTGYERDIFMRDKDNRIVNSFGTSSSSKSDLFTKTIFSSDQWYHVVYVRTYTTNTVYVNGNFDNSNTYSGYSISNNDRLYIGHFYASGGCCYWQYRFMNGKIDDIRIYNRALSADEVKAIYNEKNN